MPTALVLDGVLLVVGLALLVAGAEGLVRGGSRIATSLGVSPLVVGLTVVAFGTSSPELVVSLSASLQGDATLAVGNVVGSNVFNVLVILGATALLHPIAVQSVVVRREIPLMIGVSLLFAALALDGRFGRVEGVLFVAGLVAYLAYNYRASRKEVPEVRDEFAEAFGAPHRHRLLVDVAFVVAGLVLLVVGGRLVVDAAVNLALAAGLSDRVVALTILAAGTSLPELATSLTAAFRRETDIAVGNVVGSNVFNLLGILGISAALQPLAIRGGLLTFDLPVALAAAVVLFPLALTDRRISRTEGLVLLVGYAVYVALLLARPA